MDKETLKRVLAAAEGQTLGVLLVGKVLEAGKVPGGTDRRTGEVYDGYNRAKVLMSEGQMISVKLVDVDLPKARAVAAFVLDRVWRGSSGMGAESSYFVQEPVS